MWDLKDISKNYLLSRDFDKCVQVHLNNPKKASYLPSIPVSWDSWSSGVSFSVAHKCLRVPLPFAPGLEIQWNEFLHDFIFCNSRLYIKEDLYGCFVCFSEVTKIFLFFGSGALCKRISTNRELQERINPQLMTSGDFSFVHTSRKWVIFVY